MRRWRRHFPTCLALAFFASLASCVRDTPSDPPPGKPIVQPPDDDKRIDDTNDDFTKPGAKPGQVTVTAYSTRDGVLLQWSADAEADDYLVYRDYGAWGYSQVAEQTATSFADTDTYFGEAYSYYVVARNVWGSGQPSAVVTHAHAPTFWSKVAAVNTYAQSFTGGDMGLGTTTSFEDAGAIARCETLGVAVERVRPAEGSALDTTMQTFTLDVVYNLASSVEYEVGLEDFESPSLPYFMASTAPAGCGRFAESFTVDLRYVTASRLWLVFRAPSLMLKRFLYNRYPGNVTLVATTPAPGTVLSGGKLTVDLAYANVPTASISAVVFAKTFDSEVSLGQGATYSTEATGRTLLTIPYGVPCGYTKAGLRVSFLGGPLEHRFGRDYTLAATGAAPPLLLENVLAVRRGQTYGDDVPVFLNRCDDTPLPVTVSVTNGLRALEGAAAGSSVTGSTADKFSFDFAAGYIESLPYGNYAHAVSVAVDGQSYTLPVTLQVYDYFVETPPPMLADADTSYPILITAANAPQDHLIVSTQSFWGRGDFTTVLPRSSNEFAGELDFVECGSFYHWVKPTWLPSGTEVTAGGPYKAYTGGFSHSMDTTESWALSWARTLHDVCSREFQWQIASAPPWLRFEALAGSNDTPIRTAVFRDELPGAGYHRGWVLVTTDIPGFEMMIPVGANAAGN